MSGAKAEGESDIAGVENPKKKAPANLYRSLSFLAVCLDRVSSS